MTATCGTNAGYARHIRGSEKPCDACREAHNAYMREHNKTPQRRAYDAKYQAAQMRAWRRLAKAHPEEYSALLKDERGAS